MAFRAAARAIFITSFAMIAGVVFYAIQRPELFSLGGFADHVSNKQYTEKIVPIARQTFHTAAVITGILHASSHMAATILVLLIWLWILKVALEILGYLWMLARVATHVVWFVLLPARAFVFGIGWLYGMAHD